MNCLIIDLVDDGLQVPGASGMDFFVNQLLQLPSVEGVNANIFDIALEQHLELLTFSRVQLRNTLLQRFPFSGKKLLLGNQQASSHHFFASCLRALIPMDEIGGRKILGHCRDGKSDASKSNLLTCVKSFVYFWTSCWTFQFETPPSMPCAARNIAEVFPECIHPELRDSISIGRSNFRVHSRSLFHSLLSIA